MKTNRFTQAAFCGLITFALAGFGGAHATHASRPTEKMKYAKIEPILKAKCISCHNPERHPGNVDVSSYKALMGSGERTKTVIAGHPEKSNLILFVDGTKKPLMPLRGKPLSKEDVALLKKWVKSGAAN